MNILIVHHPEEPPGLHTDRRILLKKLHGLHTWLLAHGHDSNTFIFHFSGSGSWPEFEPLMDEIRQWDSTKISAVLPVTENDLSARLEKYRLKELICTWSGYGPEEPENTDVAGLFSPDGENRRLQAERLRFWVEPSPGHRNLSRHSALRQSGFAPDDIALPEWPYYSREDASSPGLPPALFSTGSQTCELFAGTLTLTTAGRILLCPAHGRSSHPVTLHEMSPEDVFRYKGYRKKSLGNNSICRKCSFPCRFSSSHRPGETATELMNEGSRWEGHMLWIPFEPQQIPWQFDLSETSPSEQEHILSRFTHLLQEWAARTGPVDEEQQQPLISIECPVFKSGWLIPAVLSVIYQSSLQWTLYLVWDCGDDLSRRILEILADLRHPKLQVFFASGNRGIARSRHFLSARAGEEFILPLDDDDLLDCMAVERYIRAAGERPWFGIIRGKRRFIDGAGQLVDMDEWFPFEKRHYVHGMVQDLHNHCQPYLIKREAYRKTSGWEGFPQFHYAGEDCDIYLKMEEQGSVELIDDLLYYYRLNPRRTSHILKPEGAYEMWRLLADKSIARMALPLKRINDKPPFEFAKLPSPRPAVEDIDFVIPYFETHERELSYRYSRPREGFKSTFRQLGPHHFFEQPVPEDLLSFNRVELVFSSRKPVTGTIVVTVYEKNSRETVLQGEAPISGFRYYTKSVSVPLAVIKPREEEEWVIRVEFRPHRSTYHSVRVLLTQESLVMRVFRTEQNYGKGLLERCVASLKRCGIKAEAIHIISERQSSARNRNEGFARTRKPYVCFLDDDVEFFDEHTVANLLNIMTDSEADLIGPKLLTAEGTIFCADPYFNALGRPVPKGLGENGAGAYEYRSTVPWLPTTMLMIRRGVFLATGGFDEGYVGSQMEDVDFCLKARRRNFKCVYTGEVSVIHHNHQRNDNFAENFKQFNNRWKNYPELWVADAIAEEYL